MKAHKGFEMSSSEQEVNLIKIFFNHRRMLTLGVIGRLKSMKQKHSKFSLKLNLS